MVPQRGGGDALIRALHDHGVRDPRVLDAFRRTAREPFVPAEYVDMAREDVPVPIPHGQVTSQPSLIARMVAALRLTGRERVLEVGTGLGFQTALLGRLAARVWSVEQYADLAEQARANLTAAGVRNATVVVGDGTQGLAEHAPYDGIVVSAAAPQVPSPLAAQLAEGGRLVQPITGGGTDQVFAFTKHEGRLTREELVTPAYFVPLVGRYGQQSHGR
ncbi:protein-L-isoaspartate(D-aspartate) O-methyltransferase [Thermomonospora cellulosilytica]|uniref:Protein-L-isoaspartate O-methyltransferase n=1 Tax=Thermomonospora cellulosilytica TaxID=1411118 RepID=A0A7W3MYB4_9ACTN|nr:protein-L-isoaspartate(D-aspartate) O-methyltransferase [Thermomonospora cellulosilytica]MBA9004122.1 protein-L-isoaspartate(D-aspartate) O-methyltransferase [Thermomonospora cellulosilytica]